ncbi:hypothetical protein BJV77DRAFT_1023022 [Russula vinacea]|nr:hypothetical protein BJV77DRAFT_1023022 [Russula vinacea]
MFRKCDAMCSEHYEPPYCTLPIFHAPRDPEVPVGGHGYISADGHLFDCKSPAEMQPAFHVIFIIDRSFSMASTDRQPLSDAQLGAVYSALYCFWMLDMLPCCDSRRLNARFGPGTLYSALYTFWSGRPATATMDQQTTSTRRDAYSVNALVNDSTSSPEQLLGALLTERAEGSEAVMIENWSPERLVPKICAYCSVFLTPNSEPQS